MSHTPTRVFTVLRVYTNHKQKGVQNTGGRFTGTPKGAALKAVNRICHSSRIRGRCALEIIIQEITRGSAGKIYAYHVIRKRKPPQDSVVVYEGTVPVKHAYVSQAYAIDPSKYGIVKTQQSSQTLPYSKKKNEGWFW